MLMFIAWLILLVIAWPLAILVLLLSPVIWVLSLPLRLVGITVDGVLDLVRAIIGLPARLLRLGS